MYVFLEDLRFSGSNGRNLERIILEETSSLERMSQSIQKCWQVLLFFFRNASYCIKILTSLFINKILTKLSQGLSGFSFRKLNKHDFGTSALNSLVTKLKKLGVDKLNFNWFHDAFVSIANRKQIDQQDHVKAICVFVAFVFQFRLCLGTFKGTRQNCLKTYLDSLQY